jgi:hypothetical protein
MQLSTLAILLGLGIGLPQVWGLISPKAFSQALRAFPRSEVWGYPLMLLATAWFVWNLKQENISDFAAWKPFMLVGFGTVGVLACVFVRDFLPVRGLAILLLLLAKVALDVQRWADTDWKNVVTVLAYVWVVAGVVLTVSPWWLRDWIHWLTATESRVRIGCGLRLAFAASLIVLGLTVYRADERAETGSRRLAIDTASPRQAPGSGGRYG